MTDAQYAIVFLLWAVLFRLAAAESETIGWAVVNWAVFVVSIFAHFFYFGKANEKRGKS